MSNPSISVSSLAWQPTDDEAVAHLLETSNVHAIDLVPGKYFSIDEFSESEVKRFNAFWQARGISVIGMQSLLFGLGDPSIFDKSGSDIIIERMRRLCLLSELLGSKSLTFGSPKSRVFAQRDRASAQQVALGLFSTLNSIAADHGVAICLEPNPTAYGCEFLTSTQEVSAYVSDLNLEHIRVQLDTGAALMNQESSEFADLAPIGHLHVSTPNLFGVPASDAETRIEQARILKSWSMLPIESGHATIEMLNPNPNEPLVAIAHAVDFLKATLS